MTTAPIFRILYVCSGNNARSPLAAACTYDAVGRRNAEVRWHISSAGTEAPDGAGVRPEVQRAASAVNLDLSEHRTQVLTAEACDGPDLILGMTWDQVS